MFAVKLIGVLLLAALNAFFAATEFSLVAVRLSRVRQLVARGNARAKIVEALVSDLNRVVSGVQFGITLASLALDLTSERACGVVDVELFAVEAKKKDEGRKDGNQSRVGYLRDAPTPNDQEDDCPEGECSGSGDEQP